MRKQQEEHCEEFAGERQNLQTEEHKTVVQNECTKSNDNNTNGSKEDEKGTTHKVQDISKPTSISIVAMESIEQSFVEVMRLLASEPQLETFKNEYEKLHRLLRKSYDGEKKLLQKTQELQQELYSHRAKMETAVQLSLEDESTVAKLRKEIEQAWAMADTAHAREQESREMVLVLKRQVAELDTLVEKNAHLSFGQEAYLREILATKKAREDENTLLKVKLSALSNEHRLRKSKLDKAQNTTMEVRTLLDAKLNEYREVILEMENEIKQRNNIEEAVKDHRSTLETYLKDLAQRKSQIDLLVNDQKRLKNEATAYKDHLEQTMEELSEKQRLFNMEADRLASVEEQNTSLRNEGPKREANIMSKKKELSKVSHECKKVIHETKNQQTEMQTQVSVRDKLIADNNALTVEIDNILTSIAQEEKATQAVESEIQRAMGAKTATLSSNANAETSRTEAEGRRIFEMNKRRRLQQTLEPLLKDNEQLRKTVFALKQIQQTENYKIESIVLTYHKLLDQIRSKREVIDQLMSTLTREEEKFKTQQELLDKVKNDRARTEKQFKETLMDLSMLQSKHDVRTNELNQVKDDIVEQETRLCQLYHVNVQLEKDAMQSEKRAEHLVSDVGELETQNKMLAEEVHQLQRVVAKCDAEKIQHSIRLHGLIEERNVLASQLMRKTDELTLLIDKTELHDKSLSAGASAYTTVMTHLQNIRKEVVDYRLQCKLSLLRAAYVSRLNRKEVQGDRALREVRSKVKALSESLQGKVNIHRWRQLQGNAPELYDNLVKVQLLQHRLISADDECHRKKLKMKEAEEQYEALRKELARLPGPEAVEQLALFHENIMKRRSQIDHMEKDLTSAEVEAQVLDDEVQSLNVQLSVVKKKYFEAKFKYETLMRQRTAMWQTWSMAPGVIQQLLTSTTPLPPYSSSTSSPAYFPPLLPSESTPEYHTDLERGKQKQITSSSLSSSLPVCSSSHSPWSQSAWRQLHFEHSPRQQTQSERQEQYYSEHSRPSPPRLLPQLHKSGYNINGRNHRTNNNNDNNNNKEYSLRQEELAEEKDASGHPVSALAQLSQYKRASGSNHEHFNKSNNNSNSIIKSRPTFHEIARNEDKMLKMLSTNISAPNYPLQLSTWSTQRKPQRVFVGGGFALTR